MINAFILSWLKKKKPPMRTKPHKGLFRSEHMHCRAKPRTMSTANLWKRIKKMNRHELVQALSEHRALGLPGVLALSFFVMLVGIFYGAPNAHATVETFNTSATWVAPAGVTS